MHHNEIVGLITKVTHSARINRKEKAITIVGDFPPTSSLRSTEAVKLLHQLLSAQAEVSTIAGPGRSSAQYKMAFHTRLKFSRSLKAIHSADNIGFDEVVVFLGSLLHHPLQGERFWPRIKERYRRVWFLFRLMRQSSHINLIWSGVSDRWLAVLLLLVTVWGRRSRRKILFLPVMGCADELSRKLTNKQLPVIDMTKALERFQVHSEKTGPGVVSCGSKGLEGVHESRTADGEMQQMLRLAKGFKLLDHPLVGALSQDKIAGEPVCQTPPPHPILSKANEFIDDRKRFGLPLTRYMAHLRLALNLEAEFPLQTRRQIKVYIDWFLQEAFTQVSSFWVPAPPLSYKDRLISTLKPQASNVTILDDAAIGTEQIHRLMDICFFDRNDSDPTTGDTVEFLKTVPFYGGVTRGEMLIALLCDWPAAGTNSPELWLSQSLRDWFQTAVTQRFTSLGQFSSAPLDATAKGVACEVIGLTDNQTGLGTNLNMSVRTLVNLGLKPIVRDSLQGMIIKNLHDETSQNVALNRSLRRNIVLHHVNADRISMHLVSPYYARRNDEYHIGYLLWELDYIPQAHRLSVEMLDEIWVPSEFVARIYRRQSHTPVYTMKKALPIEQLRALARLEQPQTRAFTCLICFDFHSSVERKNPLAAVLGFQLAFPKETHGSHIMIVKSTPPVANHWGDPEDQIGQIKLLAKQDSRIKVIEEYIPVTALYALISKVDCVISTHRAEGFGYIPAFALAMAKPVVATNYGGVTDFCSVQTAFPLAPNLCKLPRGTYIFQEAAAEWADVDPDDVACRLIQISDNPDLAKNRAMLGQAHMAKEYSFDALAMRYQDRLSEIGAI